MRSRGYTLVEMLVAIVVGALVTLTAIPKLRDATTRSNLRSARNAVIGMLEQAKLRAVQESRTTTLKLSAAGTALVTAKPRRSTGTASCGCDTIAGPQNLTQLYGATVSIPTSDSSFTFDARGLGLQRGAGGLTVMLTKAEFKDSVMVSGFGEVLK